MSTRDLISAAAFGLAALRDLLAIGFLCAVIVLAAVALAGGA